MKELQNGEMAICFFNRSKKPWVFTPDWIKYGVTGLAQLRDVWKHEDLGAATNLTEITIQGHDVVVYRVN